MQKRGTMLLRDALPAANTNPRLYTSADKEKLESGGNCFEIKRKESIGRVNNARNR
jgi:hypothetical protein